MQVDSPTRLVLLGFEDGDKVVEAARHAEFAQYRTRGEWFRFEGALIDHVATLAPITVCIPSLTARIAAAGISQSYASMIVNGKRQPSRSLAIHIFRKTGWRPPLIADLTDEQIDVIESVDPWRPDHASAA
jgi:hypothetical protein